MIIKSKLQYGRKLFWEMSSGIISFRYCQMTPEEAEDKAKLGGLTDYIRERTPDGAVKENRKAYVYIQAWHNRDSDPLNIITNMSVYMLTDEGKTIERIN